MIYNAGRLNRKITFYGKMTGKDRRGFDTETDGKLFSCYAEIIPARGREYYESQQLRDDESVKIIVRYRSNITHDMTIRYQNHVYNIESIVDPNMDHESLELFCTEKTRGNQ